MRRFQATEFTAQDPDGRFTNGELETLAWMAEGKEYAIIGLIRGHGQRGAKKHASAVMHKLEANSRCLAIARAFKMGYLVANDLANSTRHAAAVVLFLFGSLSVTSQDIPDTQRRAPQSARVARHARAGRWGLDNTLQDWMEYAA